MKSIIRKILLQFKSRSMDSELINLNCSIQLNNFYAIWNDFDRIKKYYLVNNYSSKYVDESWSEWSQGIDEIYKSKERLLSFSKNSIIIKTMTGEPVFDRTRYLIDFISPVFKRFIIEDAIGNNLIVNPKLLTSSPRVSHLYIASLITGLCEKHNISLENVLELGGGFGGLMSLLVRSGHVSNFKIFDLPIVLPLQYVYINAVCSLKENIYNFDTSNFEVIDNIKDDSAKDSVFISNWALTESSVSLQEFAITSKFFGANYVFICCENINYNHKASAYIHDYLKENSTYIIDLEGVLNNSKLYFISFID